MKKENKIISPEELVDQELTEEELKQVAAAGVNDTVEGYQVGGIGDDVIEGTDGDDTLEGGTGNDFLTGGAGNDDYVFSPGDGDDTIHGFTAGEDRIVLDGVDYTSFRGQSMTDSDGNQYTLITYEGGSISVYGDSVSIRDIAFTKDGTDGDDTLLGDDAYKIISGGEGDDAIYGSYSSDVNDELHGDSGNDTLDGFGGDDTLEGGEGNDVLRGGYGDDVLDGGVGDDTLSGGAGSDVFRFTGNDGDDTITDFDPGTDVIKLAPGLADSLEAEIKYGQLILTIPGTNITFENISLAAHGLEYDMTSDQILEVLVENGWFEFEG